MDDGSPAATAQPDGAVASLFVVPRSTVDLHQGGGQRTAIIFEALRELGPTTVVVLGRFPQDEAERIFAGARSTIVLPDFDLSEEENSLPARAVAFGRKYFRPVGFYQPAAALHRQLQAILSDGGQQVAVVRLFRTFALTGLRADECPVIVDVDDRDDQKARTRLRSLFGPKLLKTVFEPLTMRPLVDLFRRRLREASAAWFVAGEDLAGIGVRATVVENAPLAMPGDEELTPPSAGGDILFVGPAHFGPNGNGMAWFLSQCWPELHRRSPQTRLRIVGGGDWQARVAGIEGREAIDVPGFVPDLGDAYRDVRLAICPIFEGGGSKIKLIEACAYGRPVVATSHSTRGFSEALTEHLIAADDPAAFVEACLRLIDDPAAADERGEQVRANQRRLYSRTAMKAKMQRDVVAVLGGDQASGR